MLEGHKDTQGAGDVQLSAVQHQGKPAYLRVMLVLLTLASGVAALDAQAVFYIMPFIAADLHLDNTQIGLIGAAGLVTVGADHSLDLRPHGASQAVSCRRVRLLRTALRR